MLPLSVSLLLLLLGTTEPSAAVPDASVQERLDTAFAVSRFPLKLHDSLVTPRWLRDGERVVFWEREGKTGGTWALASATTGKVTPLVSAASLRAQLGRLLGKPVPELRFREVALTPDEQGIVFALGEQRFVLALANGQVTPLAPEDRRAWALSREHFLAAQGGAAAIQRGNGFAVVNAAGHAVVERTGEEVLAWRIPEAPWSQDGRFLVVWREDQREVHKLPVVDYTSAVEKVTWVPYSKVGTPLLKSELHVVDVSSGQVIHIPPVEGETYDWFAGWWPDRNEALFLHLSRDGKRLDLTAVNPVSGKRRLLVREERPETFVAGLDLAVGGWAKRVTPLPGGKGFLWISEQDGWRHVYWHDSDGRRLRQVTRGAFPVHEVVGVDSKTDALFLLAPSLSGPTYEQLLYRGSLQGGALKRLSSGEGSHFVWLSPSRQFYLDAWSTRTMPRVRELASTSDGRVRVRLTTTDASDVEALGYRPPEGVIVEAADGHTPLHGVIYKPRDFDPSRHYPVLAYIYGGPFMFSLPWTYVGNAMTMSCAGFAQLGFVVVMVDPRGGTGRDKAFQDANYGRVGQTEIPDYVAALKQLAASRPWMDLDHVGIHGHSWGGYFALRGMLTAPEFFKAGYAGAPGSMEEEAIINEPYMNLPSANPQGYAAASNLALAGKLLGPLKLMHGTSDVNASLSTTMRMADALIRADKHFDLLVMPGQPHSPLPPADRYYADDVGLFFLRHLGEPR
ncbi:DPP IV N-terminal domain-containing protein [Corallococcus sp. M34]|uniref:S9 family peptidase n=1 Tax=Citreicoccus inhibens TaxID=2849499 RepID=UPI001C24FF9E|nr:DPP IV N-terminal domain-containing protein [Citreicoccus inhibens]MBU8894014.1 DPP IV N-terminal domain-containing protein [Citreicoccus inhibens]